jgi:hypothetical protein
MTIPQRTQVVLRNSEAGRTTGSLDSSRSRRRTRRRKFFKYSFIASLENRDRARSGSKLFSLQFEDFDCPHLFHDSSKVGFVRAGECYSVLFFFHQLKCISAVQIANTNFY